MDVAYLGGWDVRKETVQTVASGAAVPNRWATTRIHPKTGRREVLGMVGLLTDLLGTFLLVKSPFRLRRVVEPVSEIVEVSRDLAALRVPSVGCLRATGNHWAPFELLDPDGVAVEAVAVFLRELSAQSRAEATLRSYGMDLLRWFRFLWAVQVSWDRATRSEARDFCCWLAGTARPRSSSRYAAATRAHAETVLRRFYDLHCELGTGPILNPFPLARSWRGPRPNEHHNPMEPFRRDRVGAYRPVVPQRVPRCIPDEVFDRLFAALRSHRDRALVAFFVSTGARASELLGARQCDVDPGQQLLTVVRKGSRAAQQLPASPDSFVWLALYQAEIRAVVPVGRLKPLWWTLRPPHGPLAYHGAHRMFERVNAVLGSQWTLHDLRHTAAHRMARDPRMPLTDVQWVLGHAHLSTTQIYVTPTAEEVIESVRAHHARQGQPRPVPPQPAVGYREDSLDVLFGR
jgi:site-specific recombinase XerD